MIDDDGDGFDGYGRILFFGGDWMTLSGNDPVVSLQARVAPATRRREPDPSSTIRGLRSEGRDGGTSSGAHAWTVMVGDRRAPAGEP